MMSGFLVMVLLQNQLIIVLLSDLRMYFFYFSWTYGYALDILSALMDGIFSL